MKVERQLFQKIMDHEKIKNNDDVVQNNVKELFNFFKQLPPFFKRQYLINIIQYISNDYISLFNFLLTGMFRKDHCKNNHLGNSPISTHENKDANLNVHTSSKSTLYNVIQNTLNTIKQNKINKIKAEYKEKYPYGNPIVVFCEQNKLSYLKLFEGLYDVHTISKNSYGNSRWSLLMISAYHGYIDLITYLLSNHENINVNQTDRTGSTVFHIASYFNKHESIQCILNWARKNHVICNIDHISKRGVKAIEVAKSRFHVETIELLREYSLEIKQVMIASAAANNNKSNRMKKNEDGKQHDATHIHAPSDMMKLINNMNDQARRLKIRKQKEELEAQHDIETINSLFKETYL